MTEVPIIFPSRISAPNRFSVDDVNKCTRPCAVENQQKSRSQVSLSSEDFNTYADHCGSSGTSFLALRGSNVTLTTSCLPDDPGILVIALSASSWQVSPVTMELDLLSETKIYGRTTKVQAFVDVRSGAESIRLVLVADNAAVLILSLNPESLEPSRPVEVVNIKDLVGNVDFAGARLRRTMVGFCSPSVLVVALHPLLISVNLETRARQIWLESQCKENMKARQSALTSIVSGAATMILGNLSDQGMWDMGNTTALCVSKPSNPSTDPTYVFTIHSDRTIRRWTISKESLLPAEVYHIKIPNMPSDRDWSDIHNSVYLTAKLYEKVYALAVHIQTSSSHLYVASGFQDCRGLTADNSAQVLQVPDRTTCLVDMDFVPTLNSCSLFALFRSTTDDQYRAHTIIAARYSPSVVSMISTIPVIDSVVNFVDGVAQHERARIEALVFSDELGGVTSMTSLSLEEELHEIDTRALKYLFRPSYPRGCGSMTAPEDRHIRSAIGKALHGNMRHLRTEGVSMHLEVLKAMQEWRSAENRKLQALLPIHKVTKIPDQVSRVPKFTATSVYDNYVAFAGANSDDDDDVKKMDAEFIDDADTVTDFMEEERVRLLEMHASRWKRLLLLICAEEETSRMPLGLFLLPRQYAPDSGVLVRAGFTSILADSVSEKLDSDSPLADLDAAALKLITLVESDKKTHNKLFYIEQRIWHNIATAQSGDLVPSDFAEEFCKTVDFAFDPYRGALFSVREQCQLAKSLQATPVKDLLVALQQTPVANELPGLNLLNQVNGVNSALFGSQHLANNHVRHGVNWLSVRCIDSGRRLLLARHLLLLHLQRSSQISAVAFHLYVRSLAVMWVGAQHVSRLSDTCASPNIQRKKRPMLLPRGACRTATTCLDALLSSLQPQSLNGDSLLSSVVSLSRVMYCRSLKSTDPSEMDGNPWKLLPEFYALPQSSNTGVLADYPNMALRLVAPLVSLRTEPHDIAIVRKELFAQSILLVVDSDQRLHSEAKAAMRLKACELLGLSTATGPRDQQQVASALEILLASHNPTRKVTEQETSVLGQKIQRLLYGSGGELRHDVSRLLDLESARTLFSCLVGNVDTTTMFAVKTLSSSFVTLSGLMRRVEILQKHVSMNRDASDLILAFIKGAIGDLHSLFPPEFSQTMPENLSLYNTLFHAAVSAGDWSQAYDACVNNPSFDRRVENFQTLLNSMVDAGAMGEILNKFSRLTTMGSVDLYDIAVDTLEERCSQDLYFMRANAEDPFKAAPDFTGSLYSLHVSRGEWRRAAQSMDLRFTNALRSLGTTSGASEGPDSRSFRRVRLIVEDVVLASAAAANALSLVEGAAQFIISGDNVGSFGYLARTPQERTDDAKGSSIARIKQFVTHQDLITRAVWSWAVRKLAMGRMVELSAWRMGQNGGFSPVFDGSAIDEISEEGYLDCHILLSIALRTTSASSTLIRELCRESLDRLILRALPSRSAGSTVLMHRPSLSQLRYTLGGMSIDSDDTPFPPTSRVQKFPTRVQGASNAFSSALLQKFTWLQTDSEHPWALYVAERFLSAGFQPPVWLEELLLEGVSALPESFTRYPGDPSALLSLYLHHGMLLDASRVACAMLEPKTGNPDCGLPEKGEICFVPHTKLDMLWNLFERALSKEQNDEATKGKLRNAQALLNQRLEKHFERMKIGEMGIRSSRTLTRTNFF